MLCHWVGVVVLAPWLSLWSFLGNRFLGVRVCVCVSVQTSWQLSAAKFENVFQCIEMNLICKISYNS